MKRDAEIESRNTGGVFEDMYSILSNANYVSWIRWCLRFFEVCLVILDWKDGCDLGFKIPDICFYTHVFVFWNFLSNLKKYFFKAMRFWPSNHLHPKEMGKQFNFFHQTELLLSGFQHRFCGAGCYFKLKNCTASDVGPCIMPPTRPRIATKSHLYRGWCFLLSI